MAKNPAGIPLKDTARDVTRKVPRLLRGLSEVADSYKGFVVDLWGVMHDGVTAFPEALECLAALKALDKKVVLLSNAPRRAAAVAERNEELGIRPDMIDGVVSSGEVTWHHLADPKDDWYRKLGRRCFHLGPERDLGMRAGLDFEFATSVEAADFILNTGAYDSRDVASDYDGLLKPALARRLPMVCANPDWEVIRGGKREICAGAIAKHYAEMGGDVRSHGKPDAEVYRECFALMGLTPADGLAAIGDSLRTDIAGAQNLDIDGVFVTDGIHRDDVSETANGELDPVPLETLFARSKTYPSMVMRRLSW
jgi:HAD superfamily hydrolase (TIGR01459 family)